MKIEYNETGVLSSYMANLSRKERRKYLFQANSNFKVAETLNEILASFSFDDLREGIKISKVIDPEHDLEQLCFTYESHTYINPDAKAFKFDHQGLYIIPNALTPDACNELVMMAYSKNTALECRNSLDVPNPFDLDLKSQRKLRWMTCGYEYSWKKKCYVDISPSNYSANHPLHKDSILNRVVKDITSFLNIKADPQSAVFNFYSLTDSLTGHFDSAEPNQESPLISISLGYPAIFLISKDKDSPVTPIILRHGDVLVMSGPSRRIFHGVPRIAKHDKDQDIINCNSLFNESRLNINIRQVL